MAEKKEGEKTLEMRVAELEDKLKGMQISEEEMRAFHKVSALIGGGAAAGAPENLTIQQCAIRSCVVRSCVVQQCQIRPCVIQQCVVRSCIQACILDCINECGGGCAPGGGGFSGGGFGSLGG
jgi:hypothetical protein